MEYFNRYTSGYINAIKKYHNVYKVRLELLGYYENVIGEITKDLSITAQGQININYQPITRRSCSLTLINVGKKYTPSPDNLFWYERKFKLWIGVVDGDDIYWWAQGVYFTQSATSDGNTVSIEAVDKGGALDGTLGMNAAEVQYIVPVGSNISKLVKDTLMLNTYALSENIVSPSKKPLDPVTPIIDIKYNKAVTQSEISCDQNSCLGDLFQSLVNGYNADIYYDINGHLQVADMTDGNRVDGYKYMACQWKYDAKDAFYGLSNFQYTFDGKNAVTVYTNASNMENVSYTAYNNNPASPLRVALCGVRAMESQEIDYVDVAESDMLKKCRQYADYLLIKESMRGASVTFDSPIVPHLDVNRTISITDKKEGFDNELFVIQTITIPLAIGSMSISATSFNWLPNYYNIERMGT